MKALVLALALFLSLAYCRVSQSSWLNIGFDGRNAFDNNFLSEAVGLWFSDSGVDVKGRSGVTNKNVFVDPGITKESVWKNGGLTFGLKTTGYLAVDGVDTRDPIWNAYCDRGFPVAAEGAQKRAQIDVLPLSQTESCCKVTTIRCNEMGEVDDWFDRKHGLLVKFTLNFGVRNTTCLWCKDDGYPDSTTCTGKAAEWPVSDDDDSTIFSLPVEGKVDNLMFSIRRKAKHRADFEKANCLLEDKYYTFNLRQDDVIVSKWHVYKYQGLWLEDGKDHTFLLSIPRTTQFQSEDWTFPVLFIDGKVICSEYSRTLVTVSGVVNCLDTSIGDEFRPSPVIPQEITNTKCSRSRLYLGNHPETWYAQENRRYAAQPGRFSRFRGLTGVTFKSFHIYNYHGIIDPSDPRFCDSTSTKASDVCSKYHLSPWCRTKSAEAEYNYVTGLDPSSDCESSAMPSCNEIGSTNNCRFIGDKCPDAKPFCIRPGVCSAKPTKIVTVN